MATGSKGKGSVGATEPWKHLRPFNKRKTNKRVRKDGQKQTKECKDDSNNV